MFQTPSCLNPLEAENVLPFSRRVSVRYPCGLATSATASLGQALLFRRIRVSNISQGGIALILKYPLQKGAVVHVRITNNILDFTYDLEARTIHSTQQEDGKWLVGCAFNRELTMAELASLL